jgi:hypothetical protein
MSALVLHAGAFASTIEEVKAVPVPRNTDTYEAISHINIIDAVMTCADQYNLPVKSAKYGLTKDGSRMFGVVDFEAGSLEGMGWMIGFRNSYDKSMAAGICSGTRVFVCDNMAFSGEFNVTRKHIPGNEFIMEIRSSFSSLPANLEQIAESVNLMKAQYIEPDYAKLFIFEAVNRGYIPASQLTEVWKEYTEPRHEEFIDPTKHNLLMAFTENAKSRRTNATAYQTYMGIADLFEL